MQRKASIKIKAAFDKWIKNLDNANIRLLSIEDKNKNIVDVRRQKEYAKRNILDSLKNKAVRAKCKKLEDNRIIEHHNTELIPLC